MRWQLGRAAAQHLGRITLVALLALAGYEGYSSRPYKDQAGVWTNGYGNTVNVGPHTPPVTHEQATTTLQAHVDTFTVAVLRALAPPPTQGQLDAYVSLTFNIGAGAFRGSSTAKAHRAGDFYGACLYMLRWDKITVNGALVRNRGLAIRRYGEYNTCLTGIPNTGYVPRRK
jgi:lysozyme